MHKNSRNKVKAWAYYKIWQRRFSKIYLNPFMGPCGTLQLATMPVSVILQCSQELPTGIVPNFAHFFLFFNPNCTGEGGLRGAPWKILLRTLNHHFQPHLFMHFSIEVLQIILTPSLWKSDILLRSHMTFCDQGSTRKERFFSSILCTKQMTKMIFYYLVM